MISFVFTVNKSFLESSNHPITVPNCAEESLIKEIYEGKGEKNQKVEIIPPCGRPLDGHIYYGITRHHPYYQIKVLGCYPSDYFGHLKIGDSLFVEIEKKQNRIQIFMKDDPVQVFLDQFAAAKPEKQKEMLEELKKRAEKS